MHAWQGPIDQSFLGAVLCTILKGRVTITDGEGKQTTFGPGDSFFIAQGETSTWDIHEAFQKTFFYHVEAGS